jgi:hypothetical protein
MKINTEILFVSNRYQNKHINTKTLKNNKMTTLGSPLGNTIAIGQHAKTFASSCIAIGLEANSTIKNDVTYYGINLTELKKKVDTIEKLESTIEELQLTIAKQNEMLISLWYYPGMPGANEAKEQFEKDSEKLI